MLVRLHRRADGVRGARRTRRASAVAAACRRDATVGDLAERILERTIYAQAASRLSPFRELLQNALDASPARGAHRRAIGRAVGRAGDGEVTFTDRGRGMSRAELLDDLLVPFRSGKEGDPDAIGEHGIGFLSALEIAPRLEVVSGHRRRRRCASRSSRSATGPPYADFAFTLAEIDPAAAPRPPAPRCASGSARPIAPPRWRRRSPRSPGSSTPRRARIFVDGEPINTARAAPAPRRARAHRRRARASSSSSSGGATAIAPRFVVVQKGLLVVANLEPFGAPERSLHRDLAARRRGGRLRRRRRSAPRGAAHQGPIGGGRRWPGTRWTRPIVAAFERFVLEDALYDRELLRGVDHRLGAVLDRLVGAALAGEAPPVLATAPEAARRATPRARPPSPRPRTWSASPACSSTRPSSS